MWALLSSLFNRRGNSSKAMRDLQKLPENTQLGNEKLEIELTSKPMATMLDSLHGISFAKH